MIIKGKYKGKTGVVQSVGPKTCKLKVGKELTGNINFDSLWTGAAQMHQARYLSTMKYTSVKHMNL